MIINEELAGQIYNLLNANVRVSRFAVSREDFQMWINTVNWINYGLEEDTNLLGSVSLDNWDVPEIFSDFILPRRITVTGTRKERNLRFITSTDDNDILDSKEFNTITDGIVSAFRGKIGQTAVSSNRNIDGTISNYIDREANRAMTVCKSECFPIPFVITFNKQNLLVEDCSEAVYEYVKAKVDAVPR